MPPDPVRHCRLIPAAAAAFALAGCAAGGAARGGPVDAEARRAIAAMAAEFQGGKSEEFFGRFDRRDYPSYEAFRERTRDFLLRSRQVHLDLIVDAVLTEGEEASVSAHWNRSFIDEQGLHRLQEGRCEFVLRRRAAGGFALLAINGDSPF